MDGNEIVYLLRKPTTPVCIGVLCRFGLVPSVSLQNS